jgi:hypothetical protein
MLRALKALWDARKGFRWSLYFVRKDEGLRYALHENAIIGLLGYVLGPIENGKIIAPDWELHANFNGEHQSIRLHEGQFSGGQLDPELLAEIARIDPGWRVPVEKPVFVDAITRKSLPLGWAYEATYQAPGQQLQSIREMLEQATNPNEVTLESVMRQVFVRRS